MLLRHDAFLTSWQWLCDLQHTAGDMQHQGHVSAGQTSTMTFTHDLNPVL